MTLSRMEDGHIFDWLDGVRRRPGMYVRMDQHPLRELETLLGGYYSALQMHGIVEPVPEMGSHFRTWLWCMMGWSTCAGWARAVMEDSPDADKLQAFFRLVESYKKLKPSVQLSVQKRAGGKPSDFPSRIEVVRYVPSRLHFLRMWRGARTWDDSLLMDGRGSHDTSLAFARRAIAGRFPAYAEQVGKAIKDR